MVRIAVSGGPAVVLGWRSIINIANNFGLAEYNTYQCLDRLNNLP